MTESMRAPVTHRLKIYPEFFEAVVQGRKTFEVRYPDDKHFEEGDTLQLQEWRRAEKTYTGRECFVKVLYVVKLPTQMKVGPLELPVKPLIIMSVELVSDLGNFREEDQNLIDAFELSLCAGDPTRFFMSCSGVEVSRLKDLIRLGAGVAGRRAQLLAREKYGISKGATSDN